MLHSIFKFFNDPGNCQLITVGLFCLICVSWVMWLYNLAKVANRKLTVGEYAQLVTGFFLAFLSGVLALGMLFTPDNASNLIEMINLQRPLSWASGHLRWALTSMIRSLF